LASTTSALWHYVQATVVPGSPFGPVAPVGPIGPMGPSQDIITMPVMTNNEKSLKLPFISSGFFVIIQLRKIARPAMLSHCASLIFQ